MFNMNSHLAFNYCSTIFLTGSNIFMSSQNNLELSKILHFLNCEIYGTLYFKLLTFEIHSQQR